MIRSVAEVVGYCGDFARIEWRTAHIGGHMKIRLQSRMVRIAFCVGMAAFTTSPLFAAEAAIKELGTALDKMSAAQAAKAPNGVASSECSDTAELNHAIQDAQSAKEGLTDELTRYKNLQLALTSGLVAALLTAIGALATLVVTSRNSKPERDLKRLEVVEKGAVMRGNGIAIPSDIEMEYLAVAPSTSRDAK